MSPRTFRISSVAVVLFGIILNWFTGHRGLFLNDQSIVWDGGWRILQGQVPYRDFWMPLGPLPFVIQAAFFALLGVNWSATVASACFLNGVATVSVIRSVRLLLPDNLKIFALVAGLSIAALFQTVFGTLWLEQTAFFFGFLAVWAVSEALARRKPASWLFLVLAGVFLALSILSKQNAGILMTMLVFGLIVIQGFPHPRQILASLAACAAGLAAVAAGFALWLFVFSDPSRFVSAWRGAAEIGAERVTGATLLKILLLHPSGMSSELAGLACLAVGAVAIAVGLSNARKRGPLFPLALLGYLSVAGVLVQSAFQATTLNERQNVLFFSCYSLALAAGAFTWLVRSLVIRTADSDTSTSFPSRHAIRLAGVGTLLGLNLGIILLGLDASWTRTVQQFPPGATFVRFASDPSLRGLRLGSPDLFSRTGHVQLRVDDFEAIVHYLRAHQKEFFVFGDSTLLYGMLHQPSPQPLLYFQQNHSYFVNDMPAVDRAVVSALQKNHVSIVVNETSRWQPHPDPVQSFPLLWSWMQRDFHVVTRFGVYEVWEKNKTSVAAAESGKP